MYKGTTNILVLTGNLGQDPELVEVGETVVCNASLATTRKTRDGERTDWHRLRIWGKAAENFARMMQKGSKVSISGEIQYDERIKDDEKRIYPSVFVRDWQGLSGFRDKEPEGHEPPSSAQPGPEDFDDDIPF